MSVINFEISGGLGKKRLEKIRSESIHILKEIGLKANHPKLLEMLSSVDGISIDGTRLYFADDICEKYLALFKEEEENSPPYNEFKMEGPWYCSNIIDLKSSQVRVATRDDVIKAVRLCSALDIIRPVCPLAPKDVPPEIESIASWKIALENSTKIKGGPLTSPEEVECALEMTEAVGIKGPIWSTEITISPLTINPKAIDLILRYLDKGMVIQGEPGPMISAGCTGPIFAPAFFIQAVAEWLGAYIILKVISNGKLGNFHQFKTLFNGGLCFEPMHFDMKYGSIAFGTSESLLFRLATREIFRFLGGKQGIGGAFRSSSKRVDAQAISERTMNVLTEALDGVKIFVAAGMLGNDEIFSPELLMIDIQIIEYIKRITEGISYVDEIGKSFETIRDIGLQGNYLSHDSTIEQYKKTYYFPELFDHQTLAQWNSSGSPKMAEKIARVIEEALDGYDYQLGDKVQKEIDKIYYTYVNSL